MKKQLFILFIITYTSNSISAQMATEDSNSQAISVNKKPINTLNIPTNLCNILSNSFKMPVSPLKPTVSSCSILATPCKTLTDPCRIKFHSSIQDSKSRGDAILAVGKKMVFETKEVIKGGCWDYIDTVYTRAGFPRKSRQTIFKSSKDTGPYADLGTLQAGDWLYHINHSYHDVGHSGIFVHWVDKSKNIAKMLSYAGESRNEPGRYRNYDLSHVYNIMRGKLRNKKGKSGNKKNKDYLLSD